MTTPTVPGQSDAVLVHRFLAGDRAALGDVYDRYAPRLYAFCVSLLHRPADAQDVLQDVFVIVATRLTTLRDPERLRSWLFTIARRECLARSSRARREVPVDEVDDRPGALDDEPAQRALDAELSAILAAAIDGLGERDRILLDLADRHGLPTDEVAEVVGMTPDSAYKAIVRARATARRAIGALLVARTNRSRCPQLAALLPAWSGELTPLLRKRIARHIEDCDLCRETERRVADPRVLLGALPLPALPPIRAHILHAALSAMPAPSGPAGPAGRGRSGPTSPATPVAGRLAPVGRARRRIRSTARTRHGLAVAGLLALLLIACATLALIVASAPQAPTAGSAGIGPSPNPAASPTAAATTRARSTSGGGTAPRPRIVAASVACVFHPDTKTDVPELTWQVANATGITLSVDGQPTPAPDGHYGAAGTTALPTGSCDPKDGEQSATIRTTGGSGPAATRTLTWNDPPSPPPSPSPAPSATIF